MCERVYSCKSNPEKVEKQFQKDRDWAENSKGKVIPCIEDCIKVDLNQVEDIRKRRELKQRKENYEKCVEVCEEEQKDSEDDTIDHHGKCVLRCSKEYLPLCHQACLKQEPKGACFSCMREKLKEGGEGKEQIHAAFSQCCQADVQENRAGMIAGLVVGMIGFFVTLSALIYAIVRAKKAEDRASVAEKQLAQIRKGLLGLSDKDAAAAVQTAMAKSQRQ